MRSGDKRKAIIVVSFGTTYRSAVDACIAPIERAIAEAFGEYEVYRAFTSTLVRRRLENQGMAVENLADLLERLAQEGYEEVVVQPTHIIDGAEYRQKVLGVARVYRARFDRLRIGIPLLMCEAEEKRLIDYEMIARAIATRLPKVTDDEVVVLMGHGARCADGSVYASLQAGFERLGMPVMIGVMEEDDTLSLESVQKRLSERKKVQCVHLVPLLLVAGCHTRKDMAGTESSWQVRLESAGYPVKVYCQGLGENPAVRALYIKRIRDLIGV